MISGVKATLLVWIRGCLGSAKKNSPARRAGLFSKSRRFAEMSSDRAEDARGHRGHPLRHHCDGDRRHGWGDFPVRP